MGAGRLTLKRVQLTIRRMDAEHKPCVGAESGDRIDLERPGGLKRAARSDVRMTHGPEVSRRGLLATAVGGVLLGGHGRKRLARAEGTGARVDEAQTRPAGAASSDLYDPMAVGELPQYIFFNVAPHSGWHQGRPKSFTPELCEEIIDTIGTRGHERRRMGVSFIFSILERKLETSARSLQNLLDAALAADLPVLITLDGQNWWQSRSDLWNWWDPDAPGYDPANRLNVEWTGWSPETAVKIGWRNWGRQLRVAPAPNLASPRFLAEHWKAYDVLIPILLRWYRRLPATRKYLFGGVKLGWEASINVNAYHYKNGNEIFERSPHDASGDPDDHSPEKGWTFGQAALGYAAVRTAGIKTSGELTKFDIEQVVYQYLESLCREAHRRGIPKHMIFTHQGGTYAPWDQHLSFKPAINDYSIPGWSFYSHDPPDCGSLARDLESAGRQQWAACEWWRGAADEVGWRERFARTLNFKRCRFVCVYNWNGFAKAPGGPAAVSSLLQQTKD